jgi:predicted AlkP superfamily phosphohydrolase/phosphomutase/Flp pilus assembly protein TadD
MSAKKRLLLIGWDGADWQVAKPLIEAGRMPALEYLINHGVMGNLTSMEPMLSPMLWTTIATGKPPRMHGVCGFLEPDPNSSTGVRLISSRSRRCRAFWEILSQMGIRTDVVGWYGSHPAESIHGINISDQFTKPVGRSPDDWPPLQNAVSPTDMATALADLRIHPAEITLPQLEYLVPKAREIDQTSDPSLQKLAVAVAETASRQAMTTWIMETQPWEVLAVYFDSIDHVGHDFMQYHPPKMPHVSDLEYGLYQQVMNNLYCFHDLLLNRILKLTDQETTVMLISDHGYESGHRRPQLTPAQGAGPILWHRPQGVLAAMGPKIRNDELVFGARILDITPTILNLMGLPVGEDMVGSVLTQLYSQPVEITKLPSWERHPNMATADSKNPDIEEMDPFSEQLAMQQLVELGYLEPLDNDKQTAIDNAIAEQNFNLGKSLMAGCRWEEATEKLELVHLQYPSRLMVALHLADCYQRLGRNQECRKLIEHIASGQCFETSLEDPNQRIRPQLDLLYGLLEMNEGRTEVAVEYLERAEMVAGQIHGFGARLGELYLKLQRWEDARRVFTTALQIDPEDVAAWNGLTVIHLQLEENEAAVEAALRSVAILFHQPQPHFWLGLALCRLTDWARAREALAVALKLAPNHQGALRQLARIEEATQKP